MVRRRVLGLSALSVSLLTLTACPGDDVGADTVSSFTDGTTNGDDVDTTDVSESGSSDSGTDTVGTTTDTTDTTTDTTTDSTDTTTGDEPCMSDDDCVGADEGPICDTDSGNCVPCTPESDVCDEGQYCTSDNLCEIGCAIDEDCGENLVCDVDTNTCTGCVIDGDCPLGSVCEMGNCVSGCTDQQPCQDGFSCCGDECKDLANDPNFCGACDAEPCPDFPNATDLCVDGVCTMGDCEGNFNNCNGDPMDGCETTAQCACVPGETISCYTGFPANTEGVGLCQAGLRTCNAMGTGYGACVGQVIPAQEICNSGADENCNGQVDENPDFDQDGWGVCDGDCCDQVSPECSTPDLVNPGAFEVGANQVDDDCDGSIDNPLPLCDAGLAANSGTANDYAKAIDLCQFTSENPPLAQKKWGVINSWLRLANDAGAPSTLSRSIRPQFGSNITTKKGSNLAVFSSGTASYPGAPAPTYAAFQIGTNTGTSSLAPADWLTSNGGSFPNAPGCTISNSTTAYNPVMYKVRVRVPTNANSFSTKMYFFSAEYPEYVCTSFNDFFVTLVKPHINSNPFDDNIAIYAQGNNTYPVGVNLAKAANGLFSQCQNGSISQCGTPSAYNGCLGTNELLGTGFNVNASACGHNGFTGGGTGWLTMSGNVTPGSTIEVRFVVWDTGDQYWDSLVLLDDWQWSVQAAQPGVTPG